MEIWDSQGADVWISAKSAPQFPMSPRAVIHKLSQQRAPMSLFSQSLLSKIPSSSWRARASSSYEGKLKG